MYEESAWRDIRFSSKEIDVWEVINNAIEHRRVFRCCSKTVSEEKLGYKEFSSQMFTFNVTKLDSKIERQVGFLDY